jgi:putative DNA primase/helicase
MTTDYAGHYLNLAKSQQVRRLSQVDIDHARAVSIAHVLESRPEAKLRRTRNSLYGPCLICGGRDRFWVGLKLERWQCRHCHREYSDVIGLVQWLDGVDFVGAVRLLLGQPAGEQAPRSAPKDKIDPNMVYAGRIWRASVPIEGTIAEVYLRKTRKLDVPAGLSGEIFRFHPACPFLDYSRDPAARIMVPALIALYLTVDGNKPVAIHRTALAHDGGKSALPTRKLTLGPWHGAAIKLSPPVEGSRELAISEGIETGLASMMRGHTPLWVAGCKDGIGEFPVMASVERLTIIVDNDLKKDGSRPGPEAAIVCSRRWTDAGKRVRRVIPTKDNSDMADLVTGGIS